MNKDFKKGEIRVETKIERVKEYSALEHINFYSRLSLAITEERIIEHPWL